MSKSHKKSTNTISQHLSQEEALTERFQHIFQLLESENPELGTSNFFYSKNYKKILAKIVSTNSGLKTSDEPDVYAKKIIGNLNNNMLSSMLISDEEINFTND